MSRPLPHSAAVDRTTLAGFLEDAALLAGDSTVRDDPAAALAAHRAHLQAWYRDLVGALVVPPTLVPPLLAALTGEDHGLRVVLATGAVGVEAPLAIARQRLARDTILDDSRLDLVGVEIPLPIGGLFDVQGIGESTRALLAALDFSAPCRIDLGAAGVRRQDVDEALRLVAEDAAEELALPPDSPADVVTRAAALGLRLHGSASAAVDGQVGPPAGAVGRFAGIAVASVADAVDDLVRAGLLDPAEEG